MPVVTISRQLGSGGTLIGERLAARLGLRYIDKEIIVAAAQRAGDPTEAAERYDEKGPSFIERMVTTIFGEYSRTERISMTGAGTYTHTHTWPYTAIDTEPDELLGHEFGLYTQLIETTIREVAALGNVIIIGRGGQIVLRGVPGTCHLHFVGPLEDRINRLAEAQQIERDEAEGLIKQTDHNRADYLKQAYQADWQDPLLYDLIINTGRTSFERAVDLAASLAVGGAL